LEFSDFEHERAKKYMAGQLVAKVEACGSVL